MIKRDTLFANTLEKWNVKIRDRRDLRFLDHTFYTPLSLISTGGRGGGKK